MTLAALEDDLWEGDMRGVVLAGRRVLLVKREGRVFAYEDRCAHLGARLSAGSLVGDVITCGAHHWKYAARGGHGINPKTACLRRYGVHEEAGRIVVDLGGEP